MFARHLAYKEWRRDKMWKGLVYVVCIQKVRWQELQIGSGPACWEYHQLAGADSCFDQTLLTTWIVIPFTANLQDLALQIVPQTARIWISLQVVAGRCDMPPWSRVRNKQQTKSLTSASEPRPSHWTTLQLCISKRQVCTSTCQNQLDTYFKKLTNNNTQLYINAILSDQHECALIYKGVPVARGSFKINIKSMQPIVIRKKRGNGTKLCLAILYNLYRFKNVDRGLVLIFKFWLPEYLYYIIEKLEKHNKEVIVKHA